MTGMNDDARYVHISERVHNHTRQIAYIDVRMCQALRTSPRSRVGLPMTSEAGAVPNGRC